jgi:zinc transporter, ZIP family
MKYAQGIYGGNNVSRLVAVTIIGFLCGMIGTGLGGFLTILIRNPSKRFMAVLLGFTSGVMLSVVCFDLLPEAFKLGSVWLSFAGMTVGVGLILLIDEFIPSELSMTKNARGRTDTDYGFIKSGMLLGIGIAIHNFPEGLAVGSGFAANNALGLGLAIVIALHDVPEGVAMAAPLKMGGINKLKVLIYTILAGIPMGVGAFIGEVVGGISPIFICLCLSFAAGSMLFITCGELIPKSQSIYKGRISTIGMLVGIMSGIFISSVF